MDESIPASPRRADLPPEVPELEEPDDLGRNVSRETKFKKPSKTRVLVTANQKGGVGKTTSAVNLAVALALGGLKVLVVDVDPQGNASTALSVNHNPGVPGTYEVLLNGLPAAEAVKPSPEANTLYVLPATIDLAAAELQLAGLPGRETRLKTALASFLEQYPFDYVFFDCPPSLGLLTVNALVAATEVFVPIQCEYYALEGVTQLLRSIELVKKDLNPNLEVSTILLTMYDGRTKLSEQVADEVRKHFAEQTLENVIPRSVRVAEAPGYQQSVISYFSASAGAQAYLEAAEEVAAKAN